ncbi:Clp protease N-terminal domain-containing protein [Actinomadura sp. DC4]|uniref:Clp protease N-terminal domain-containing protein n=1 Tax=Actinomadura sp. DC4 TaxID=3055069 RepID=UPI0025B13998|nr:Clp protease N-terminal domain-containing protein [Actinomadura sp. DC4]MDN3351912.1 Clp protease N-terminal domain-containing protein [Actinomadura sp. DC4]
MSNVPQLRDLVGQVVLRGIGGPRDPLTQLDDAERLAAEISVLGERLVGYFVEQARAEGLSWADIGAHKGISRQAAQQRYSPYISRLTLAEIIAAGTLATFGPRALDRLHVAERHARGRDALGTEHLLLAILDDTGGLAVTTLTALGAPPGTLRPALTSATGTAPAGTDAVDTSALLTDDARRALDGAAAEAHAAGHEVATVHLLLGLLRNPASAAGRLLAAHGVTRTAAARQIEDHLNRYLQESD